MSLWNAILALLDWLEQRGGLVRAEFLRVQDELLEMAPGEAEIVGHASRLGALAIQIDVAWRARVASPPVERCGLAFNFRCAMEWSMLKATKRDSVRHGAGCQQDLYYALTVGDARSYARDGHCVALDVTSARWRDDLRELDAAPRRSVTQLTVFLARPLAWPERTPGRLRENTVFISLVRHNASDIG